MKTNVLIYNGFVVAATAVGVAIAGPWALLILLAIDNGKDPNKEEKNGP